MKKKHPSDFDIELNGSNENTLYESEIDEHRIDRLGQRMTQVAVIFLCLIAAAMAVAYFDVRKKLQRFDSSGTMRVQKISENLDSSFSSLSVQVAKLEESLNKQMTTLQTLSADLDQKMKKLERTDKSLRSVKVSKNTLTSEIKKIEATMGGLREELAAASGELQQYKTEQQAQLQRLSTTLAETTVGMDALKTATADLSALRTDIQNFESNLRNERKAYRTALDKVETDMRARILALEKRIAVMASRPAASSSAPSPATPQAAPPSQPPPQTPGQIVEQDIK